MMTYYSSHTENEVYYYHSVLCGNRAQSHVCLSYAEMQQSVRSKHLGSTAYLTNDSGQVSQVLNYLPYGEDWVEIHNITTFDTTRLGMYRFNGKEKDYESGFHYYGARYYWGELLTSWLSVDPMADKYPSISPYAYCAWNPVKLVDPDGEEAMDYDDGWLINHENKTVTRISDNGGNQRQYTNTCNGDFPFSYNMSVVDFMDKCQTEGYKIKESSSTLVGLGLTSGAVVSTIANKALFAPILNNYDLLQETSKELGHGLKYTREAKIVGKIEGSVNTIGKALGFAGVGLSFFQLMNDNKIEDAAFHIMDMAMGGMGMIPLGVTNGMALGWSLFGRQVIKAQAESYKVLMDLGLNPGDITFAPFK